MKLIHRVVKVLLLALLLGGGLGLLLLTWRGDSWAEFSACVSRARLTVACAGIGSICLGIIFVLSGLRHRDNERFLSFENGEGRVNISTQAISDYVSKLSSEFPSVVRMTPRVSAHSRRGLDMVVDVRIKAGPQLHEICEVLQNRVRETMIKGLGIPEVRRVVVCVKEISSEHKST